MNYIHNFIYKIYFIITNHNFQNIHFLNIYNYYVFINYYIKIINYYFINFSILNLPLLN